MIVHVDMDAFFASVEQLDRPELAGKCVIVGGESNRGVVCAASYAARKFGVHSAMPMFQARRKCPHAVIVRPRPRRYAEISSKVMELLGSFSPVMERVSIDEAFLDITGCAAVFGTPVEIGERIRRQIREGVGLTCSVGVAPRKFLAKIASAMIKPDGLTVIRPEDMESVIAALPIGRVPGVGPQTGRHLDRLGIKTLGDVLRYSESQLAARLGKYGRRLHELSQGIDRSEVRSDRPVKSISSEETFAGDTRDKPLLKRYLLKHAGDVGRDLRKEGLKTRTITVKIKFADFTQITRQVRLERPTAASEIIYRAAASLVDAMALPQPVRLIGVGASDFSNRAGPIQLSLFPEPGKTDVNDAKWEKADRAMDAISERFGRSVVTKASLKDDGNT
jgi:DNA polymerase IV